MSGLSLVPFVPLIVSNNMVFPHVSGKNFAFRILVELLVGVYALLAFRAPEYRPHVSGVLVTAVAFVGWLGVATIFSVDPPRSFWSSFVRMEGYISVLHLFAYFLILACVLNTERQLVRFFEALLIASAVMGTYCCFQLLGRGWPVSGTLGNPTYLAAYMQSNIFIAAFLLVRDPKDLTDFRTFRKIFLYVVALFAGLMAIVSLSAIAAIPYLFEFAPVAAIVLTGAWLLTIPNKTYFTAFIFLALILQVISLIFTGQRGPIGGTVVGLFLAGFYAWFTSRATRQTRTVRTAMSVCVGLALVIFVLVCVFWSTPQFSNALSRTLSVPGYLNALTGRLLLWKIAWGGFLDHPVFGYGQEHFGLVFNKHYEPALYELEPWFDKAHNFLLDWLVAGGFPAFALAIAFFVCVGKVFLNASAMRVERAALLGLLCAYAFQNMFSFDNLASSIYFFGVAALAHNLSRPPAGISNKLRFRSVSKLQTAAIPIVAILTFGVCYLVNAPGISGAIGLLKAVTVIDPATEIEKPLETNRQQFEAVLRAGPLGEHEATLELLKFAGAMGSERSSIIELEERSEFYQLQQTAIAKIIQERHGGPPSDLDRHPNVDSFYRLAHNAIAQLASRRPNDVEMEVAFGKFLNQFGQNQEASLHFNRALKISPNKQTILLELGVNTYLRTKDNANALPVLGRAFYLEPRNREARIYYAVSLFYDQQGELADRLLVEGFGTATPENESLLRAYISLGYTERVTEILKKRAAKP